MIFFLQILPSPVYQMSLTTNLKSEFYQQQSRLLNVFLIIRVTLCKEKFIPPSEKSLVALGMYAIFTQKTVARNL